MSCTQNAYRDSRRRTWKRTRRRTASAWLRTRRCTVVHPTQQDPRPTTYEYDAYNASIPRPPSQQKEKGSSRVGQDLKRNEGEENNGSSSKEGVADVKAKTKAMTAAAKREKQEQTKVGHSVRRYIRSDPKECEITEGQVTEQMKY